ncbi:MAG: dihydropteroate synthase [bacterium]|jgi:cobalamin-dependent methionine synthase I
MKKFIVVGENIHCTRIYKVGGTFVRQVEDGSFAVVYGGKADSRTLPIPGHFLKTADWEAGKIKHCAVAVWQGLYGDAAGKAAAVDYLRYLARRQEQADAAFLDVNVDEFSTDVSERIRAIQWVAGVVQATAAIPLSIDSSNPAILRAGLEACDPLRGHPMVNSVSLERQESISVAAEFKAVVIASAAGETDLPSNTEQRLVNLNRLMPLLNKAGICGGDVYVDPLVFPVATDSNNAQSFLEAVVSIRKAYGPEIHISGGLSNVSFGMPARKLINQAFTWMVVEAGGDSGIVDPLQMNAKILASVDTTSESFKLARALLTGEDMFGVEFIMAHREGKLVE